MILRRRNERVDAVLHGEPAALVRNRKRGLQRVAAIVPEQPVRRLNIQAFTRNHGCRLALKSDQCALVGSHGEDHEV